MTDYNSPSSYDQHMLIALEEAQFALAAREVPVGCIFICGRTGEVLAKGRNRMTERCNATSHAELLAASFILKNAPTPEEGRARLKESTLYVTVEPCIMCAAAMLNLGIKRIVFGCFNENFGGCGTVLSVHRGVRDCLVNSSGQITPTISSTTTTTMSTSTSSSTSSSSSSSTVAPMVSSTTSSTLSSAAATPSVIESFSDSSQSSALPLPHPPLEVVGGIREKEAIDLLRAFYRAPNPKAPKNFERIKKDKDTEQRLEDKSEEKKIKL